jgi:hypothetical protein
LPDYEYHRIDGLRGSGDLGGIQSYSRNNVVIANGAYAGGENLTFEMRAWRTSQGSGCNTTFNKVDNFTWMITVHYVEVPDDGAVGIGTATPDPSAILEIRSIQKGFLPPRMTISLRDGIPDPVHGLIVYCTDCLPPGLCHYNGTSWEMLSRANLLSDADGDSRVEVEQNPAKTKSDSQLTGRSICDGWSNFNKVRVVMFWAILPE